MITKLSHSCIWVLDQDEALDFYTNKLGFTVETDAKMEGGFRWLTVKTSSDPGHVLILMSTAENPMMEKGTSEKIRELVKQGTMGAGVFEADDCRKTYEELKSKGVEFLSPPEEKFYGIEAVFKDNSGNWFSMTQRLEK